MKDGLQNINCDFYGLGMEINIYHVPVWAWTSHSLHCEGTSAVDPQLLELQTGWQ